MQGFMRHIVPKHIIVAGFALFMGGAILTGGLFPFDMKEFKADALQNWHLFAIIRDAGAILAAATIIISGLRSIRIQGSSRRLIAMVLIGMGISLLFLTLNCVANVQMGKMLISYDFSKMIGLIELKLKQDNLPEENRPVLMRKLAESRYLQSGERILILTADNEEKIYEPPETIIGFKRNVDFSRQMYGLIKQWSYYSIYVWIGVLLFSTIVGAVSPED
ncbi:MAG: hypothetical protein P1P89_22070 [Desulfobacterales bacterium]|nr:hypothetical protein [Desulfobacterales bacterium]